MLLPGVKIQYTITDVKIKKPKEDSKSRKGKDLKNQKAVALNKSINENVPPSSNKATSSKITKIRFEEPIKNPQIPRISNLIPTLPDKERVSPRCYSPRKRADPLTKVPHSDGWNMSTSVPNRDDLIREQDNIISKLKVKENNWVGEENVKETFLQTQDKRLEQKEKLRVIDVRANRYSNKSFGSYVNNPYKHYPFLHEDPIMVALNHGKWDVGSDRYSDIPTRSVPEKLSKDHDTFAKQYKIKNEKRIDHIAVSSDTISEIKDMKNY